MKRLAPIVVAFCAAAFVPAVVNAHGGEAGILVFPAEAPIGATVTVFGEDLAPDTTLELYVLTAVGEVLIGEPMTDEVGHFSFEWTLPADLAPRVYELRLAMPAGETASTYVTVTNDALADPGSSTSDAVDNGGLPLAVILGLAGIGVLAFALRPARNGRAP